MARLSRRQLGRFAAGVPILLAACQKSGGGPIDESKFIRVGGIDQWIAIQGRDAKNPAILYLHGGPGEANSPFLTQFLPWETDFTVVNWDQRGSGKTYGRNGASTPDMTLDRLIDDAIEIAEHIRDRLKQRKVVLVGQSWGSFLGVNVIKRRPELFHAFVGTGQLVSVAETISDRARCARQQATAEGDQATLKALDEAASLPDDRRIDAEAAASKKWLSSPPDTAYGKHVSDFVGAPPGDDLSKWIAENGAKTKGDVADWIAGARFTGSTLGSVVEKSLDLHKLGLDMPIPFFIIQGREDHIVGFEPARAYAEEVRAPSKAFVPIDGGHYACFTNAAEFVAALRKYVRPLAS